MFPKYVLVKLKNVFCPIEFELDQLQIKAQKDVYIPLRIFMWLPFDIQMKPICLLGYFKKSFVHSPCVFLSPNENEGCLLIVLEEGSGRTGCS